MALAAISAATVATGGTAAKAAKASPIDLGDKSRLIRRLRYQDADGLFFLWMKAQYQANVDGELVPLHDMAVISLMDLRNTADGGFTLQQLNMPFRLHAGTTDIVKSWKNPITGEQLRVPFTPMAHPSTLYGPDCQPKGTGAVHRTHYSEPYIIDERLFMKFSSSSVFPVPGRQTVRINDMGTFHAPLKQLVEGKGFVASGLQTNDIMTYPHWMNMDKVPGTIWLYGHGRKAATWQEMPADIQAVLKNHDPVLAAKLESGRFSF